MSETVTTREYLFQPQDDFGNDFGKPVTITYDGTDADLAEKLSAENAGIVGQLTSAKLRTNADVYPDAEKHVDGSMDQASIEREALLFQQSTPAYRGTPENFAALVAFMTKHQLSATAANWKLAFDALVSLGVLVPNKTAGPVEKSTRLLTIADIDRMPADVYKRKLLGDAEFAQHVESLYK